MNISDIRIRLIKRDETKFRAVASIIIDDCFVIHDIKIIEDNDGNFIAMPSRKRPTANIRISRTPSTPKRANLSKPAFWKRTKRRCAKTKTTRDLVSK